MSVSGIMKNILSFAEILSQSGGRSAQHWDRQSLQNAVKWAKYCEQIYHQAVMKGFVVELDRQVQSLVIYLRPATCMEFSMTTLQHATGTLRKNLLQNPYISDEMFAEVMSLYATHDHPSLTFTQECCDIVGPFNMNKVLQAIVQQLSGPREINSLCMCQGEQLLSALIKHKSIHPSHESRFKDYLNQLLKLLTNEELGWDVIACTLLCDIEQGLSESEHIKQLILSWLQHSNYRFAQRTDRNLLCKVSEKNINFYQLYLDSLIHWGENMCINYSLPGTHPLYTWGSRSKGEGSRGKGEGSRSKGEGDSLEMMSLHWSGLLSNSFVGIQTKDKLLELSLRDEPNIFRDIRKSTSVSKENEI